MEAARNRAIDALAVWVCDQQTSSVAGHRAPPQRGLPEGVGRVLKMGSDLVIQNHYHPTDRIEMDQSSVGLYFSKSPVEKTVFGFPLGKPRFLDSRRRQAAPGGQLFCDANRPRR